ncbi:MAG: hypothetical protein EOP49_00825 [Sphingobacteriales bacterium]|nr:MAG: hypothetical protein EOP49_00825 [Sphingobacteriales bacterium]
MIQLIRRPDQYTPSGNPVIFQVESNNPDLAHFKVKVSDTATGALLNQLAIHPTPNYQSGSYVDLSKILDNTVRYELNTDSFSLVTPITRTVRGYDVSVEEILVQNGVLVTGATLNDSGYVFSANLGRITAHNFQQVAYVINQSSIARFLTLKPNYSKVNDVSSEYLYLIHDGSFSNLFVRVRTFNASGVVESIQEELDLSFQAHRLNVSPKSLTDSSSLDFSGVSYYVVDLVDHMGVARSEERVYLYEPLPCNLEVINVLFVNSLGGLDSYQFAAPQDSINVTRTMMKKNTFGLNEDGVYTDMYQNVYNASDVVLNSTVVTSTKMYSRALSDEEARWLAELYISRQVFIELPDGALVPAILKDTSYQIQRARYMSGQLNTISIDLTLSDGILPAGVTAYSSRRSSIEFIDSQMNALVLNIPGYGINPQTGRHYSSNYSQNYR